MTAPPPACRLPSPAEVAIARKSGQALSSYLLLGLTLIRNSPPLLVDTVPPVERWCR